VNLNKNHIFADKKNKNTMKKLILLFSFFSFVILGISQNPGDILVTEIMADPAAVDDSQGEYFELFNATSSDINIDGWIIKDDGSNTHTLDNGGSLIIAANDFLVIGKGDGSYNNRDYQLPDSWAISNSDDEIVLEYNGTEICRINYTDGDMFGDGIAMELNNINNHTAGVTIEDDYVAATSPLMDNDMGSPGFAGNTGGISGGNANPIITGIVNTPEFPASSDVVNVSANITDSDGTITNAELHWGTTSGNLTNTINMSTTRATYTTDSPIPAQANGTIVYFEVYAQDNDGGESTSPEITYTVHDATPATLPYYQSFDFWTDGWTTYSVTGAQEWEQGYYGEDYFAVMSGYSGGAVENEDWLISPAFNLNAYNGEQLSFESAKNYNGDDIVLLYSTDYTGSGDPNSSNWTDITSQAQWSTGGFDWVNSGAIDLSGVNGSAVYIAFKYTSTTSDAAQWEIDDITLEEVINLPPEISNINYEPSTLITSEDVVDVTAQVTDSDGTLNVVELHWGTTSGSLTNTINMSTTRATYTTDSPIPAQADGTTVYFEVYAQDNGGAETTSAEMSYTVTDPSYTTIPYSESFDINLGDVYTYSVSGDTKQWYWDEYEGNGFAAMNGYNSGETEEDWLILPGFNPGIIRPVFYGMEYDLWYKYGNDDDNNYLKAYFSTDYSGLGDPGEATWTEVALEKPAAAEEWTQGLSILDIDFSDDTVFVAFKYHYEAGSYRKWEVDNVVIDIFDAINEVEAPELTVSPNPTTGMFYIEIPYNNAQVRVFNLAGMEIENIQQASGRQSIDLTGFPKGIYTVTVQSDENKILTRKIIVK
jgi:hypothetical protein